MTVSTPELAAAFGISRQRVNELGRKGKITREPDGRWDVDKVRAALGRNLDIRQMSPARGEAPPQTVGRRPTDPPRNGVFTGDPGGVKSGGLGTDMIPDTGPAVGTLAHAQLVHETAKAKKAALEARRLEGSLVDREAVEAEWTAIGSEIRDRVMALPSRVINRLPSEWRSQLLPVIEEEARSMLTVLSDGIRSASRAA